jgi:hypothetical protein
MVFEYNGFIALRLAMNWYMVMGQNLRGYATSENEAWQIIKDAISRQCWE